MKTLKTILLLISVFTINFSRAQCNTAISAPPSSCISSGTFGIGCTISNPDFNSATWLTTGLGTVSGNSYGGSYTPSILDAGTTITVTVVNNAEECFGGILSATASIYIQPVPVLQITNPAVCFPNTANLTAATVTAGSSSGTFTYFSDSLATLPLPPLAAASVSTSGTYYIKITSNGCTNFKPVIVTINPLPIVTANATATTVCSGAAVTLTGGGAISYLWTGGVTNGTPFHPTNTATYTVTGTDANNCSGTTTKTITAITPEIPSICMVTVDDASNYNIIYWDKTPFVNTGADSFIVYRETTSNVYKRLGSVSIDSMSSFTDTVRALYFPFTGNPNIGTYRYKLQIHDSCGNLGAKSLFHNTIYANQTGGTFNWNHYQIEGEATPIPGLSAYLLERDNNNTGSWTIIGGVAGSQTTITDPSYASYPNGRWRISTSWSINCTPTRASINTTRSNIKHQSIATGLNQNELSASTMLYPNPANDKITIELSEQIQKATIKITNTIGQTVYEETIISTGRSKTLKNIDISNYAKGIYTVTIENNNIKAIKKLVVN